MLCTSKESLEHVEIKFRLKKCPFPYIIGLRPVENFCHQSLSKMVMREEVLGKNWLAVPIQSWLVVPKTLLKSLKEFVDSFLAVK